MLLPGPRVSLHVRTVSSFSTTVHEPSQVHTPVFIACTRPTMRRVDAGKVELDGAQYLGFKLPFTVSQLTVIEAILVGGAEIYRNGARGLENRIYPGASQLARSVPSLCWIIAAIAATFVAHMLLGRSRRASPQAATNCCPAADLGHLPAVQPEASLLMPGPSFLEKMKQCLLPSRWRL